MINQDNGGITCTHSFSLTVFVPFPSCVDTRYPEPQPDGAAGQTQPQQARVRGGTFPPVAEEDVRLLLRPQS